MEPPSSPDDGTAPVPPGPPRRVWTRGAWLRSNAHPWTPRWAPRSRGPWTNSTSRHSAVPMPSAAGQPTMVVSRRHWPPHATIGPLIAGQGRRRIDRGTEPGRRRSGVAAGPTPSVEGGQQCQRSHRRGQPDRRDRRVGQAVGPEEPADHPAGQRPWRHRRRGCDQRTEGRSRPRCARARRHHRRHLPHPRRAVFWDVHDPAKAVVIELADEHYARLVVQVADPGATVALVENSTQRP